MRKVPPILKPIALLTISTIIATATGVVNSAATANQVVRRKRQRRQKRPNKHQMKAHPLR